VSISWDTRLDRLVMKRLAEMSPRDTDTRSDRRPASIGPYRRGRRFEGLLLRWTHAFLPTHLRGADRRDPGRDRQGVAVRSIAPLAGGANPPKRPRDG
jgi:hypothetical protein